MNLYNTGGTPIKTTDYDGEFIYQGDTLQFVNHEEGRVVMKNSPTPEYQYHLKDHLGNVRVTFTTAPTTKTYTAGFETANQTAEANNFGTSYPNASHINTVAINAHSGSNSLYLNGSANGGQVAMAKSLSVMPGDMVSIQAYAKYNAPTGTQSNLSGFATALLSAFNLTTPAPGETGTARSALNVWGGGEAGAYGDGSNDNTDPKVFVTILMFDRNYNFLDLSFQQLTPSGVMNASYTAKQPGYAYLYVSNEQAYLTDVYFDDITISQTQSPVVQQEDFYPFGLSFNSYTRENTVAQNYLYNGKEQINDLGIDWADYGARMYMPEIGRWGVVDPLAEKYISFSPYAYGLNDPIKNMDHDGREVITSTTTNYAYVTPSLATVHDLGNTSITGLQFSENKDGTYNVSAQITISMSNHFAGGPSDHFNKDAPFSKENPGLHGQVLAHEKGHADQFKQVLGQTGYSFKAGGKVVSGTLDKVATAYIKDLKSKVAELVKNGASAKEINKLIKSSNEGFTASVAGQVNTKMLATFGGNKQGVEDNANGRAISALIKSGQNTNYINGAPIMENGKVVPKN